MSSQLQAKPTETAGDEDGAVGPKARRRIPRPVARSVDQTGDVTLLASPRHLDFVLHCRFASEGPSRALFAVHVDECAAQIGMLLGDGAPQTPQRGKRRSNGLARDGYGISRHPKEARNSRSLGERSHDRET